jgi:hypothetical protein
MAASVRIEDEAFSDARYAELAEYAGLADADHARGKMAQLWRQCTLERCYSVSAFLVRQYLGSDGVNAIVRARLGEQLPNEMVRIRGTKGRIEWLEKLRKNGRKGGRPAKYSKKPSGYPVGSPSGYSELNPPAPAPAPAPANPPSEGKSASPAAPRTKSRQLQILEDKVDAATGPHQQAIAEFTAYYQRAHDGAKPTWNGKTGKLISELVKAHGLAEVTRRIGVLETAPPKWPPAPWDLPTFVSNFDKVASANTGAESAIDVAIRFAQGDFR